MTISLLLALLDSVLEALLVLILTFELQLADIVTVQTSIDDLLINL